jgi:U3 small nucleolar RNA-associated protein 15
MPDFKKLKLKQFAQAADRETAEGKYWKTYAVTLEEQLLGAPSCVHFNPLNSNSYLVTSSTKVTLYDSITDKAQRSFTRFADEAYSGRFRKDGKLILAGDKSGAVKVFDAHTKVILRESRNHKAAVHSTLWSADGLSIVSGSDDGSVKRWDLGTQEVVWDSRSYSHSDYVRCCDTSPISPDLFVSCGYDHIIKVWDARQPTPVHLMDQGKPIEACSIVSSGALLLTSGGNEMKVWDLLSGGRLLHTFSNHQKNISSICYDPHSSRVLTGGLDGLVKVYSLQTLKVTHGMRFGTPVSCLGISPSGQKLVVGFTDCSLMVRTKATPSSISNRISPDKLDASVVGSSSDTPSLVATVDESNSEDNTAGTAVSKRPRLSVGDEADLAPDAMAGLTSSEGQEDEDALQALSGRFYKGAGQAVDRIEDGMVDAQRSERLRPYEMNLKKFNYQQALDSALRTKNPLVVITVLEELCFRSGLTIALSSRDESTLEPLLSFISRYIVHPRYCPLLTQVVQKLLDIYSGVLGRSDGIDELFFKLQRQVRTELTFQKQMMKIVGSLDCVIHASTLSNVPTDQRAIVRGDSL